VVLQGLINRWMLALGLQSEIAVIT
jgi:hypothetical protein